MPVTKERVEEFMQGCAAIHQADLERTCTNPQAMDLLKARFETKETPRYFKVYRYSPHGSIHCFIDKETGDVLKPDGVKRPAEHARGNLFDEYKGLRYMGPFGPAYLR